MASAVSLPILLIDLIGLGSYNHSLPHHIEWIHFADVLGNGTTGLVFSENHPQPRHWYYDLCNKQKPYLLNQVKNNLGAETKITYASSTKFYLQDKQQGTPWVTKLPFPVQVVEKVENFDLISNTKLVSCYSTIMAITIALKRNFVVLVGWRGRMRKIYPPLT